MSKHASKRTLPQKGDTKKEASNVSIAEPKSEVARIRLLIEREYEAAEHLQSGLAITARHAFITARMENIGRYHEQLIPLVGENEANRVLCEAFSGGDSSLRSE